MVAAVFYFATPQDHEKLLNYLGEPAKVTMHPGALVRTPLDRLNRTEALRYRQVMVLSEQLGAPTLMALGDQAMAGSARHAVFSRLTWGRLRPSTDEHLINFNASPVLFWEPAEVSDNHLGVNKMGSQADSMSAISADYARWVNRTMAWIQRNGTKVWGLDGTNIRPDLDIDLHFVNSVYALPGALTALERGVLGR